MIVVVAVQLALAAAASADTPMPVGNVLETDGSITEIRRFGSELMLSGNFERIGPYAGSGVGMDPASGALDPTFPRFDGQVSDAIDDGNGGWYVGGQFLVGGAEDVHHLVHVLPSGSLDPAFKDHADDFVTALALAGGRLYASRYFEGGVRAFDPATGERIAGFKMTTSLGSTAELEVADGRLYIGGSGIVAVDAATGAFDNGFACGCPSGTGNISALAHDGTRLYLGTRKGQLFAVDLATGDVISSFAPQPDSGKFNNFNDNGPLVFAIDGNRLLVGGRDLDRGGASSTLVALDKVTGAADPSFATGFDQPVHDMVLRGDAIVASGAGVDSASPVLTTLDRATGAVRSSVDTSLDGPVDALAGTGSRVLVGGRFRTHAAVATQSLAMVDATTGEFVPGFSAAVDLAGFNVPTDVVATDRALVFWRTDYAGRNRTRVKFTALSRATGARLENFRPPRIVFDYRGRAMFPGRYHLKESWYEPVVLGDADRIYVGHVLGNPKTVWPRSRIDVLSATTGRRIRSYKLPLKGYLTALAMRDGKLYAGGSFRRFRFGHPAHLATLALNPLTGAMDKSFDAHTNGPVYGIGVAGQNLYLSGIFNRVSPLRRVSIAAVDARHGFVDARFRVAGTHFNQTQLQFGPPLELDTGLLNVGPPDGYYPFSVSPVDATTGRRIPIPFQPDGYQTLLPVGGRYYATITERLEFENYSGRAPVLAGFLPAG
ncbi:MAG: hypothetical protein QOJ29_3203 [Thermoleophilaceae bacterium]|nr:hypothetical protein [Thermoleophilaceae bacterium]